MAIDAVLGEVTTEKGDIPADEPVVVLRGSDPVAPTVLDALRLELKRADRHQESERTRKVMHYVDGWQAMHPDQVGA